MYPTLYKAEGGEGKSIQMAYSILFVEFEQPCDQQCFETLCIFCPFSPTQFLLYLHLLNCKHQVIIIQHKHKKPKGKNNFSLEVTR